MLLLNALKNQNDKRPPIWLMRQAGRYMPQYQKMRKGRQLVEMFHDVKTIVEVTLLPIDLLNVDAAILFSDILSVCDGLGLKWHFEEGKGPQVERTSRENFFPKRDPQESYAHIFQAIQQLKKELKVPLLGFAGAPFTVASYLVEGEVKKWLYEDPKTFHKLLARIADETIDYLNLQIEAGCDAVQIFDSWAHTLGIEEFRIFSLPYVEKIVRAIEKKVPVILFCKGYATELANINPHAISPDWSLEIDTVRKQIPSHIALQGNLDPMALYGSKKSIEKKVGKMLSSMQGEKNYIFNLGHGILPDTPFENVKFLVDYVRSR